MVTKGSADKNVRLSLAVRLLHVLGFAGEFFTVSFTLYTFEVCGCSVFQTEVCRFPETSCQIV